MKDVISTPAAKAEKGTGELKSFLNLYVLHPLKGGLWGFVIFFVLLLMVKYLGYVIGSQNEFLVDQTDLILSMVGFVLVFLIRLLENFKEKE